MSQARRPLPRHAAAIWADNSNITRTRIVPIQRLQSEQGFHVKLTNAIQALPSMWDAPFESPVGEVYFVPDSTSTQALHDVSRWMPGAGAFFGDMRRENGDAEWAHCPRSFLRRQVTKLFEKYGVGVTVGFELEFQVLERATQTPIDASLYCSMKAFHDGRAWALLRDIVECLEDDLGIEVHQYHAESASGQLEISTGVFGVGDEQHHDGDTSKDSSKTPASLHADAIVGAVDKLVLARQTIHALAAQRGLQATFVPKLKVGQAGNAAHVHIGLVDVTSPYSYAGYDDNYTSNRNLFASDATRASAFLAGVLEELPGLCMLLAPTVNSYARLQPQCWAGAYQCYGYENREAPVRLVGPTSARDDLSRVDHFEIKTLDSTANPYLALGAILAAGMGGLDRGLKLPVACSQDPSTLSESERPSLLPRSLDDAIGVFEARRGSLWDGVLSESYALLLVTLRRAELGYYGALEPEDQVRELLKRY